MHIPNVAILLQKKNPDILNVRTIKIIRVANYSYLIPVQNIENSFVKK